MLVFTHLSVLWSLRVVAFLCSFSVILEKANRILFRCPLNAASQPESKCWQVVGGGSRPGEGEINLGWRDFRKFLVLSGGWGDSPFK